MIRIAVIDDQAEEAERIRGIVAEYMRRKKERWEIWTFVSSLELLYSVECGVFYALYLIDIEMPGFTGLQLAREIREVDADACIIFVTNYVRYALTAHEVNPFRYIRKRKMERELPAALEKLYDRLLREAGRVYIARFRSDVDVIPVREIYSVEKDGKNVRIHHKGGRSWERTTIREVWERLGEEDFAEVRRGLLVNLRYIRRLRQTEITLTNGERYPVSPSHLEALKEKMKEYWDVRQGD